jgi:acyl-CoA thioesterase FadM
LQARTWVSRVRREMFSTREVRIAGPEGAVARATQEWVHVAADLTPTRAGAELLAAFPVLDVPDESSVTLPDVATKIDGRTHTLTFRCWHTWMDPLAHINHPVYVDWSDESVSCAMKNAHLPPVELVPVAESAVFKSGVVADQEVTVSSSVTGLTASGDVVFAHRIVDDAGTLCAQVTTVRRLATQPAVILLDALR